VVLLNRISQDNYIHPRIIIIKIIIIIIVLSISSIEKTTA